MLWCVVMGVVPVWGILSVVLYSCVKRDWLVLAWLHSLVSY